MESGPVLRVHMVRLAHPGMIHGPMLWIVGGEWTCTQSTHGLAHDTWPHAMDTEYRLYIPCIPNHPSPSAGTLHSGL